MAGTASSFLDKFTRRDAPFIPSYDSPLWSPDDSPMLPKLDFGDQSALNPVDLAKHYDTPAPPQHTPTVKDTISFPSQFLMQTGRVYGYANPSASDTTPSARQANAGNSPAMGGFTPQSDWENLFKPGQIDIPAARPPVSGPGIMPSYSPPSLLSGPAKSGDSITGQYGTASVLSGQDYKAKLMASLTGRTPPNYNPDNPDAALSRSQ